MRDQHMNPEDAVKALADCGAQAALAHHHSTFQLADEAIDAPVIALGERWMLQTWRAKNSRCWKPGQVVEI
jgi:L-ascorbate metabolism protein UlaG (beta-lactamase superfamily)